MNTETVNAPAVDQQRLVRARWFERGWERAIDVRAPQWEQLSQSKREKLTNRWSLAAATESVASGDNIPPRPNEKGQP